MAQSEPEDNSHRELVYDVELGQVELALDLDELPLKSSCTAFILCAVGGMFAIHRFYLDTDDAVIRMLTLNYLLVGWFVDFVTIPNLVHETNQRVLNDARAEALEMARHERRVALAASGSSPTRRATAPGGAMAAAARGGRGGVRGGRGGGGRGGGPSRTSSAPGVRTGAGAPARASNESLADEEDVRPYVDGDERVTPFRDAGLAPPGATPDRRPTAVGPRGSPVVPGPPVGAGRAGPARASAAAPVPAAYRGDARHGEEEEEFDEEPAPPALTPRGGGGGGGAAGGGGGGRGGGAGADEDGEFSEDGDFDADEEAAAAAAAAAAASVPFGVGGGGGGRRRGGEEVVGGVASPVVDSEEWRAMSKEERDRRYWEVQKAAAEEKKRADEAEEARRLAGMSPDERASYLAERNAASRHEERKDKHLKQQLGVFGSSQARNPAMLGRGRGRGRGR